MPLDPHAVESPVEWIEWGPAAFDRAVREEKPILLRISAMWCHWCHVMDETTDADPEVARRVNEWFVPVRVDNDERPDINDRYNLGGWPTTAFLTPSGELITGGTYFPATQFVGILERIHDGWENDRNRLDAEVKRIREQRVATRSAPRGSGHDGESMIRAVEAVLDAFDWRFGGFGTAPKFPQPEAIRLLLHAHAGSRAEAPLRAAIHSLDAMRNAGLDAGRAYGLYDHEAGGFFRYSTTRDWSEPHFEKMAEDNARLAHAYLDAFRVLGEERHAETVHGIYRFVLSTLSDPDGGAFGSQDADGEADYYGRPLPERLTLPTPIIDHRFYTHWNGMLAATGFEAAAVLGWSELEAWATRTIDRIDASLATSDGGVRHVLRPPYGANDMDPDAPILLTDHAWWLQAMLGAYQATGRPRYLARGRALAIALERDFFDVDRGACRDRPVDSAGEAILDEPHYPLADNAAAAAAWVALGSLTGETRWRERANTIVDAMSEESTRFGYLGSALAVTATQIFDSPVQIHLVGSAGDPQLQALRRVAWTWYRPGRVVEILDPKHNAERCSQFAYPAHDSARAFVCIDDRCLEPARDPSALSARLAKLESD